MHSTREPDFDTLQLYAGHELGRSLNARAVPIYASTSFCFDSTMHQLITACLSVYSRISNSTVGGMSAQFVALLTLTSAGDNIVSTSFLYGGKFGIQVRFVVDNTLGMGGYLFRPIDYGAVQSATKWIGGHGTTIAGILVNSGHFDWKAASDRFPSFNTPSEGFQNVIYADLGDSKAFLLKLMLREVGPALNPFAAFLLLQGVETLSLRAERHCENAMRLAKFLDAHPKVSWVSYLGLNSHPSHLRAKSLFPLGGVKASKIFINNLRLASHLANIEDAKTLVIQPAATTHIQSSDEEQLSTGVTRDLIRVSVGTGAVSDIITDFEGALSVL
ncbi:O-acetylhomoserine ami [Desarmillaria tabescens]|uniref:O-acetylhomoserine ami n=1 Tax=Armillaria tabescens TaxID=1929756 RepID=A0AA39NQ51_ARMTA|nr:O-acetylhomoserine ami [Desarmillaria tabescens]KAK0469771.1 O-acetylhomoserine ami [Desarmillaria tabescens]